MLDIDHLHKKIAELETQQHSARRTGQTTAKLVLLIGQLEVGDDNTNHLVITPSYSYGLRVCDLFCNLLEDANIKYKRLSIDRHFVKTERGQVIVFMGFERIGEVTRGRCYRTVTCDIPAGYIDVPTNLEQYIQSILEENYNADVNE